MKPADFRELALGFPAVTEGRHMGHPDFRIGGRIFATLGYPREGFGVVGLAPTDQAVFVGRNPRVFAPAPGGWGRLGSTVVALQYARRAEVREALAIAWRRRAPKPLREHIR